MIAAAINNTYVVPDWVWLAPVWITGMVCLCVLVWKWLDNRNNRR